MRKLLSIFLVGSLLFATATSSVQAENVSGQDCVITFNGVQLASDPGGTLPTVTRKPETIKLGVSEWYRFDVVVKPGSGTDFNDLSGSGFKVYANEWGTIGDVSDDLELVNGQIVGSFDIPTDRLTGNATYTIDIDQDSRNVCQARWVILSQAESNQLESWNNAEDVFCKSISITPTSDITTNTPVSISFNFPEPLLSQGNDPNGTWRRYGVKMNLFTPGGGVQNIYDETNGNEWDVGFPNGIFTVPQNEIGDLAIGSYEFIVFEVSGGVSGKLQETTTACRQYFCVGTSSNPGKVGETCDGQTPDESYDKIPYSLCGQIPQEKEKDKCEKCLTFGNGIWTALGCIPANPVTIVQTVVKIGLSIAGGVAILMVLAAGFMLSTSQGDPKKTTEAREMITSAVIGLLFIIFSITILQFVGVSVFQLPGFGGS
jgi:hypothetical protein